MGQPVCLYPKDKVKITGELVGGGVPFNGPASKPPCCSNRMSCAKCFASVVNDHTNAMGVVNICGGLLDFPMGGFKPTSHIYYDLRVMDCPDGLPKFKDAPKEWEGTGELVPEVAPPAALPSTLTGSCYCGAVKVCAHGLA